MGAAIHLSSEPFLEKGLEEGQPGVPSGGGLQVSIGFCVGAGVPHQDAACAEPLPPIIKDLRGTVPGMPCQ